MQCFDEDLITDDLVGEAEILISNMIGADPMSYNPSQYPLIYKKKPSGEIYLEARLLPSNSSHLFNENNLGNGGEIGAI